MNISLEKKSFSEAVHTVARFAERKSATLPALSAILIVAGDDGIKLRATNLETGVDFKIPGQYAAEGVVALPAATLQQLASSLSGEGKVTLEQTGDTVRVVSGTARSTLKTVPYEDFPSIPHPSESDKKVTISGEVLRQIFTQLSSCASTSSVRPELACIFLSLEGGVLTAVATDSFRLAEKKVPLTNKGAQGALLIPAKNAAEIAQALPEGEVAMFFNDHQCAFQTEDGTFVTRLTNATYPDYRQIIPKEFTVEATVLCRDFESALKRTTIFADSFQKVRLSFMQEKKQLAFYANNTDIGESLETIPARVEGGELEISFNHRYLSAALPLSSAESFVLSAAGIGRPLVIRGAGDNTLLYLVSPMNQ